MVQCFGKLDKTGDVTPSLESLQWSLMDRAMHIARTTSSLTVYISKT